MQGRQRVRFQGGAQSFKFHTKPRVVFFRDYSRVVDQDVEPAESALQVIAQVCDACGVGDIKRAELRRQLLPDQSLDRLITGVRPSRGQDNLRAAYSQLATDFEADPAIAAGDHNHRLLRIHGADGSPRRTRRRLCVITGMGSYSWRRSLNAWSHLLRK